MTAFHAISEEDKHLLLYVLVVVSLTTDLLEGLIRAGDLFVSPMRIYIVIVCWCIAVMLLMRTQSLTLRVGPVFRTFFVISIVFLGLVMLSITSSSDPWYSVKRTMNMFSLILLTYLSYFLARLQKTNIRTLMNLWLSVGLVLCFIGGLQYLFDLSFGAKALEYSHRTLFFVEIKRISSLFKDPNFFGYFLISFLFLSICYPYTKNNFLFKPHLILIAFVFIVLTGSRGTIVAVLAGCVLYAAYDVNIKKTALASVVPLIAGILLVWRFSYEKLLSIVIHVDVAQQSILSRFLIWHTGLQLALKNPLLGVGPGNFVRSEKGLFLEGVAQDQQELISGMAGHSNYLEIAAESGVLAMVFYVFMIGYVMASSKRAAKIGDSTFSASLKWIYLTLGSMIVANIFLSYYSFFTFVLMGLAIHFCEKATELRTAEALGVGHVKNV